jgi:hypothetical protein
VKNPTTGLDVPARYGAGPTAGKGGAA